MPADITPAIRPEDIEKERGYLLRYALLQLRNPDFSTAVLTPEGPLLPAAAVSADDDEDWDADLPAWASLAAFAVIGVLLLAACGSSSNAVTKVDATSFVTTASRPDVAVIDVRTPEEFAALMRAETAKWDRLVKQGGVKLN